MPQMQNLVLTDRAATPVAHTFTPRSISGNVGEVVESTGVPVGNPRATISLTKTTSGRYKATFKLEVPAVQNETINGVTRPVVVRKAYANLEVSFDETSTTQERNNVMGMLQTALMADKALVHEVFVDLEGVY